MQSNDTSSPLHHIRHQNISIPFPISVSDAPANCTPIGNRNETLGLNISDWENIPETLILNCSVGITLFIVFTILTRIAWRRADSTDQLVTQNIITFLYGYRDPDQWYVIPRLEFLRREDRHHRHDLQSANIYVPPKLPLANPLEMIALGNHDQENSDSGGSSRTKSGPAKQRATQKDPEAGLTKNLNDTRTTTSSKSVAAKTAKSLDTVSSEPLSRAQTSSDPTSSVSRVGSAESRRDPTTESNFYPSILTAEQLRASWLSRRLNKLFGVFFRVSDADLIFARGVDAYEYLLFQRHLILIMFVATILCIGVILPIHWFAREGNLATSFQRTTIKNINSTPILHWAHIICSSFIVITTLKVMSSYRESIITQTEPQISKRTLLIGNIPSEQRTRVKLMEIFREYFTHIEIEAIQFVYDCKPLVNDEMYLSSVIAAKDYCNAYKRKSKSEIYVHRTDVNVKQICDGYCRCCSFIYVCCCYWPCQTREPGTVFYAREEERFRHKIAATCQEMVKEPTEYAFVTFRSYRQARRVISELATMKRDAIEMKPRLDTAPMGRKPKSRINDVPHGPAKFVKSARGKKMKESQAERQINIKTAISKYVETSNSHSDPLDPKNNPHVRSIRSPKRPSSISSASKDLPPEASKATAMKSGANKTSSQTSAEPKSSVWDMNEGPIRWSIRYAPHPDNIEFKDLLNYARTSKWTVLFLHLLMVIIFIFVTTPNVLMSILERVSVLNKQEAERWTGFKRLSITYLSILLQITTTAILPALVTLISKQIPYEDSSSKSHSVMWKSYSFLVLMVIVMPSIGMSSATKLFNEEIHLMCLFPTDNGAYYINYVVSTTFLSTILELLKPVDIIFYYFIFWTSRSVAEVESGRQFIEREFSVGMQHTAVLLIFSVAMTYSISCPLIAPAGLIYLCVKHSVDHYNLYYCYFTRKVDKDMQSTIVIFVKVALLLMLFQTTISILLNTKGFNHFSIISQMIFWVVLATLGFNCFFDCTARSLTNPKNTRWHHEFCACFYMPKEIASLLRMDAIPPNCLSRKI